MSSNVISGIEPCGCIRAVWVLDPADAADAYRDASKWAKAGCTVVTEPIEEWRNRNDGKLYCADHLESHGPPTWKRVRAAMRAGAPGQTEAHL